MERCFLLIMILGMAITDFMIHDKVINGEFFKIRPYEKEIILTIPYAVALFMTILLPMYFARKWTREFNENIDKKT